MLQDNLGVIHSFWAMKTTVVYGIFKWVTSSSLIILAISFMILLKSLPDCLANVA